MLLLLLASLSSTTNALKPNWQSLHTYTFDKYLNDFNINLIKGSVEYETKQQIFNIELKRIITHNNQSNNWKENVNHLSLMTESEKRSLNGRHKGVAALHKPQNLLSINNISMMKVSSLPDSIDWRTEGVVSAVKDQVIIYLLLFFNYFF